MLDSVRLKIYAFHMAVKKYYILGTYVE